MKWRYAVAGAGGLGVGAALMFLFTILYQGPNETFVPEETSPQISEPDSIGNELALAVESETQPASIPAAAAPIPQAPSNNGGPSEGIKVHGHWTVDILEQDGTLVSHTEFENALLGTGGRRIAEIIGRRMLPRYWGISLRHNTLTNSPCINSANNSATSCVIYEPQGIDASFTSNNLTVTPNTDGTLVLSGTITAQRDGQISSVTTLHNGRPCAAGVTYPDGCSGSSGTEITRTNVSPAINVVNGQVISTTVRISFE